jgi:hypothetical protein
MPAIMEVLEAEYLDTELTERYTKEQTIKF